MALRMASRGLSALHAAGAAFDGNGFVFPACKGVGKTSTLIYSAEKGASYLSNEKCIISRDGCVYGFPSDIHLYYYNANNDYLSTRLPYSAKLRLLLNRLTYELSLGYASFPLQVEPSRLFNEIENEVLISSLILLTKTDKSDLGIIEHVDKKQLIGKLVSISVFDMSYLFNLFEKWLYVSPEIDLVSQFRNRLNDNLAVALEKIPCFEVEIPRTYDASTYLEIYALMRKQLATK